MIQHKKLEESINPLLSPLLISSTNPCERRKKKRENKQVRNLSTKKIKIILKKKPYL